MDMMKKMISLFYPQDPEERESFKETLPFFLFAITVLGWLYFLTLNTSAVLATPWRGVVYTVLYIVHLALYWSIFQFIKYQRGQTLYILLQGLLAFALVWISGSFPLAIGLYCALVGNIVGMLGKSRQLLIGVLYYLVLLFLNFILLNELAAFQQWLSFFLPAGSFAAFFSYFLRKQMDGREKDQRLLKELEVAHQQLAKYSNKLESLTLTNERQRMARELHDTLAQGLAGLILQLEAADHHLGEGNSEKSKEIVQQAMTRARVTLVDARKAIDNLRVEMSGPEAFAEGITREVERFKEATGILCELNILSLEHFDEEIYEHIYRIISESLTNIARHAQANLAGVKIEEKEGMTEVTIYDDGIGFDQEKETARHGHYGLLGIRERVRLAGGKLKIVGDLGLGTHLRISIPIKENADD